MERAGPQRRTFDGARVRRVSPGLSRAALWLAFFCAVVPFLPELLGYGARAPGGADALLAATRDAMAYWLAGAGLCVVAALTASRGFTEPVTVTLDARCLYVATKRLERRTPRWMIEDVHPVRPQRREVWLQLSSGRVVRLVFETPDQARRLTEALAKPQRSGGRRAGSQDRAALRTSS